MARPHIMEGHMLTRKRYGYYRDECTWDDLYLACDPEGVVVKVIIFWDDEPGWREGAQRKAERICRWLNRKPPLRIRLARLLARFDPTGNHQKFRCMTDIAEYLYGDMEDRPVASA